MIKTWHECRIKYDKQDDEGKIKKVNEAYLIEALTYTEAETRLFKEQGNYIHGEYIISNIKRAKYTEIIPQEVAVEDPWFNVKYAMIIINEVSGKEQKVRLTALVQAEDLEDALKRFGTYMKGTVSDIEITSVTKSPILDCYKSIDDETIDAEIEANSTSTVG